MEKIASSIIAKQKNWRGGNPRPLKGSYLEGIKDIKLLMVKNVNENDFKKIAVASNNPPLGDGGKLLLTIALMVSAMFSYAQTNLPLLKISANHRYFETDGNKPFFWLGDTGWLLFGKLTREEAAIYLEDRKQKGFNVIQVMVLHELGVVNVYGDSALNNRNVATPKVTPGNNSSDKLEYDFWDHMDYVIDLAASKGIYIALVPVWGGNIKRVNETQAKTYASFLANRYKDKSNIIWLNGGDINGGDAFAVWNTIGNTLRSIDKNHLIGFIHAEEIRPRPGSIMNHGLILICFNPDIKVMRRIQFPLKNCITEKTIGVM
jgi:hypothetical protein